MLRAWYEDRFELVLANRQHTELTDVFSRPKIVRDYRLAPRVVAELFTRIDTTARVIPSPNIPVQLRDPKDEHILAAAIGGNADYLATGDADPLVHQGDPRLGGLEIVTGARFLAILDEFGAERELEL